MKYKQCENCGKYFLITTEQNKYCSIECEKKYVKCTICGNYYEYEPGMDENNYVCCDKFIKPNK